MAVWEISNCFLIIIVIVIVIIIIIINIIIVIVITSFLNRKTTDVAFEFITQLCLDRWS